MSNYDQIEIVVDNGDGTVTPLAGATVKIWDVDGASLLATLTADGAGIIPAGTLAVAVGTKIRLLATTSDYRAVYDEFITT